jgi:glycerate dehydrogenase
MTSDCIEINKLVVLDKNEFNGRQRDELKRLAKEVVIYEDMPKSDDEAIRRIGDADAVIVCWYSLSERCVDSCPDLKYIGVVATGYGWLAAGYAAGKGIAATNVPGYATNAVSAFIFRQLGSFDTKNKTIAVIGLGRIGSRVAETAKRNGLKVICWNRTPKETDFEAVGFDEAFKMADVIVLQMKSNEETKGIVKNRNLNEMKDGAIIVNVVSPKLFESEDYLISLMKKKKLKLVLDFEEKSRLAEAAKSDKNIIYTPGIAWRSDESIFNLHQIAIDNLKSYKNRKTQNKIS